MIAMLEQYRSPENKLEESKTIFRAISALNCPTFAVIHGHCLGGGLELALHCNYRILVDDPSTKLGLPEVMLGLHPGWRGTVLLPELIAPTQALPLMLSGRTLNAKRAKSVGLADLIVPARQVDEAPQFILQKGNKRKKNSWQNRLFKFEIARKIFGSIVTKQTNKLVNRKHYPAPFVMIDNWVKFGSGNSH